MTLPTPRAASAVLATCVLPFASSLGQESEGLHTAPLSRAESHGSAIPAEAGAAEAGAAHAAGEAASSAGAGVAAGAGQVGSEAPPHRRRSARCCTLPRHFRGTSEALPRHFRGVLRSGTRP